MYFLEFLLLLPHLVWGLSAQEQLLVYQYTKPSLWLELQGLQ